MCHVITGDINSVGPFKSYTKALSLEVGYEVFEDKIKRTGSEAKFRGDESKFTKSAGSPGKYRTPRSKKQFDQEAGTKGMKAILNTKYLGR
jgi:hypothetical protein